MPLPLSACAKAGGWRFFLLDLSRGRFPLPESPSQGGYAEHDGSWIPRDLILLPTQSLAKMLWHGLIFPDGFDPELFWEIHKCNIQKKNSIQQANIIFWHSFWFFFVCSCFRSTQRRWVLAKGNLLGNGSDQILLPKYSSKPACVFCSVRVWNLYRLSSLNDRRKLYPPQRILTTRSQSDNCCTSVPTVTIAFGMPCPLCHTYNHLQNSVADVTGLRCFLADFWHLFCWASGFT